MNLHETANKDKWALVDQPGSKVEFLQSYEWGEFQIGVGREVIRLESSSGDCIQGFIHNVGFGWKYAYFPRVHINENILIDLIEFLKTKNIFFVRFETINNVNFSDIKLASIKVVWTNNRQPNVTLLLDLKKSNAEILASMHPKTRYNIHLAEKKGVIVKEEKNGEVFWELNKDTIGRDDFKSHNKEYYKQMLDLDMVVQLTAYFEGVPIASNICINYNGVFIYLHGASANVHRNVMAPYLLQWYGIQLAKKLGCKEYDFWGMAPVEKIDGKNQICYNNFCWNESHPWSGVTRFKVGFGGVVKNYPGAFEVVISGKKYKLFNFLKKLKFRV